MKRACGVKAFDNKSEKGVIACMKYKDGDFTDPEVVLEESFHLSYPYVYEENGELKCEDGFMEMSQDSLLTTVFKDGKLVREDNFMDIRARMYGGKYV